MGPVSAGVLPFIAGRNAREFSKSQGGLSGPSISQNAHISFKFTGRNGREFSNSQGGLRSGPGIDWNAHIFRRAECPRMFKIARRTGEVGPVSAGMLTFLLNSQGGMPANFQNRKADSGVAQYQPECSHFGLGGMLADFQNRKAD